ncbi:hypothetical protein CEXT_292701 [Caerostris extrusa]|uniref:Uncharacterized protein n=1 Tax=Caerostris extrusa TaxID=172846 RepID=A0AAV4WA49_CAEEX|nr:hypothetical protein CEXT_292701 [Caerostris extrusa]
MDEIYYVTLRNKIAQYTTIAWTSIVAVFSTQRKNIGLYDGVFRHHFASIRSSPLGKTRLRTADPPEDDDPWLECGPDPWNFAAQLTGKGMMMDIQCSIRFCPKLPTDFYQEGRVTRFHAPALRPRWMTSELHERLIYVLGAPSITHAPYRPTAPLCMRNWNSVAEFGVFSEQVVGE